MLVLISGLPGTGKSTIARPVAARLGTPAYSRDWARKAIAQAVQGPPGRFADAAYRRVLGAHRPMVQKRANQLLETITEKMLTDGCHAVLEMIAEPSARDLFHAVATRYDVPFRQVECVCTDRDELLRRLARRPGDWEAVLRRAELTYVAPDPGECLVLDTSRPAGELLAAAAAYLGGGPAPS